MTVFVVHPVILAISLFGGIAYSVLLKGWKKTVKFNLIFSIPMMLIVALMNPMFNHAGGSYFFTRFYIEFIVAMALHSHFLENFGSKDDGGCSSRT